MSYFCMKGIGIGGIACAVPDHLVSVKDFSPMFGEEATVKFTSGTGIREMYKALPEQTGSDLAYTAAEHLLSKININRDAIGALLFVSQSPDYRRPATACVLQKRLGLPVDCAAMDIGLGCSGFVYGMQMAISLMLGSDIQYALVLLGETASKLVHPEDRSIVMMYGDAGAAVLMQRCEDYSTSTILKSDGNRFRAIILPAGGFRDMNPPHDEFVCSDGIRRSLYDVFMDGTSVFSFATSDVPATMKEYLRKTDTTIADYDQFIFHQANHFILKQICRKMKIPAEQTPISLDRYGNSGGVSIPLTLCDAFGDVSAERFHALLCGFGIGLSWGLTNAIIDTDIVFPIIKTSASYTEGKFKMGEY